MFGTIRPRGVAAAMPRFMKCLTWISAVSVPSALSTQVALTLGLRAAAQMTAFARISSGETLMPSKSRDTFSRLTNSMVRLASTSTKMLTCGAEKADSTMAFAVAFLTPLTGMRSMRWSCGRPDLPQKVSALSTSASRWAW